MNAVTTGPTRSSANAASLALKHTRFGPPLSVLRLEKLLFPASFRDLIQKVKPVLIKDPAQDKCGLVMFVQYSDPGY